MATINQQKGDLTSQIQEKEKEVDKILKELDELGLLDKVDPRLIHSSDGDRAVLVNTARKLLKQRQSVLERIKAKILRRQLTAG